MPRNQIGPRRVHAVGMVLPKKASKRDDNGAFALGEFS
jgi:hypothetical protein